jgi:hypothetical protein
MKKQDIRIVVAKKHLAENIFTTYEFPKLEQSEMSELKFRFAMERLKFEREGREREHEEEERECEEKEKEREKTSRERKRTKIRARKNEGRK